MAGVKTRAHGGLQRAKQKRQDSSGGDRRRRQVALASEFAQELARRLAFVADELSGYLPDVRPIVGPVATRKLLKLDRIRNPGGIQRAESQKPALSESIQRLVAIVKLSGAGRKVRLRAIELIFELTTGVALTSGMLPNVQSGRSNASSQMHIPGCRAPGRDVTKRTGAPEH